MIACVTWVVCLQGWCASVCNVCGLSFMFTWVACQRGWHAIIIAIVIIQILSWWKKIWMFTLKTKMKKCSNDLKEEPDFKRRCWFTLFELVMPGYWICLNPLKSVWISVTFWICVENCVYISQSSKYAWICLSKFRICVTCSWVIPE